ncbi:MAG: hypothetical protein ACYTG3_08690 [Planctomycetota bacterium]|jgi:type II secretory pathway component GspD/PulD (secretin)
MKRALILSFAVAVCGLGCNGSDGGSQCAVLSESTGSQLSQADGPVRLVNIEARIVSATTDFSQSLGVDWDFLTSVQQDNGGAQGGLNGDFADALARSGATGGEADRLYMIPGNYDPNSSFGVVWPNFIRGFGDTAIFMAAPPFVCFFVDGNSLVPLSGFPGIDLSNLAPRDPGLTGSTIHTELLDDAGLGVILSAIQAESLNTIVTAPTITAYNGQRATITVQDFTPPLARLNPEFLNAVSAIAPSPFGIFTGLTLEVTPTITEDDRVIMNVRLGSQAVSAFFSQQFDADGQPSDLEFPVVQTSRAYTEIEVADGETAFIGGITRSGQSQMEAGLPVLKDLPLVGVLFGDGNLFQDSSAELLILVTPRIIQPN